MHSYHIRHTLGLSIIKTEIFKLYFNNAMVSFKTLLFLGRRQELFYEDRHYHEHCFRCFRCDRSLADEPFTSQDEALLCNDCYCNEFSSKCVACDKIVMPGEGLQEHIWLFKDPFHCGFRYPKDGGWLGLRRKMLVNVLKLPSTVPSVASDFISEKALKLNKDKPITWKQYWCSHDTGDIIRWDHLFQ